MSSSDDGDSFLQKNNSKQHDSLHPDFEADSSSSSSKKSASVTEMMLLSPAKEKKEEQEQYSGMFAEMTSSPLSDEEDDQNQDHLIEDDVKRPNVPLPEQDEDGELLSKLNSQERSFHRLMKRA